MPKLKTRKSVTKRFKITKNKKVKRSKAKRRHLMTCKSGNDKRGFRKKAMCTKTEAKKIVQMVPYI